MSVRSVCHVAALVGGSVMGASLIASPSTAQFGPDGDVYIGIILPEVADDAPAWQRELAEQVEHGAILGEEEHAFNSELLGITFDVFYETGSGPEGAVAAAERLREQGVLGIAGGFTLEEAVALGEWANEAGLPFLNLAVQSDALRNDLCSANTFHIEASAGMYLDSLAGWYIRDGYRDWYVVRSDTEEGASLEARLTWALEERHFGVGLAGEAVYSAGDDVNAIIEDYDDERADLLMLLVDPGEQLEIMAALQAAGFEGQVAAYPYPATQTREYFNELVSVAPDITHYRAVLWEPTLDTSGAIEFNLRHRNRWDGETMDGPAWAGFHAVKVLFDSASFSTSVDPEQIMAYMRSPNSVFDLHKLIGASFRPWNQQLRQPLYLVGIDPSEGSLFNMGLLVGQLPSLYLPGTEPNERLDQIGDTAATTTCRY